MASFIFSDNIRIASSNTIANLLEDDFKLTINNKEYYVKAPEQGVEVTSFQKNTLIRCNVYTKKHLARFQFFLQGD